eukprot:125368_1
MDTQQQHNITAPPMAQYIHGILSNLSNLLSLGLTVDVVVELNIDSITSNIFSSISERTVIITALKNDNNTVNRIISFVGFFPLNLIEVFRAYYFLLKLIIKKK